jgi:adenylate cyclase
MSGIEPRSSVVHLRQALSVYVPSDVARQDFDLDVVGLMRRRIAVTALVFVGIHVIAYFVATATNRMVSWTVPVDRMAVIGLALGCYFLSTRERLTQLAFPISVLLILGTSVYLYSFLPRFGLEGHDLPGFTLLIVAASVLFPWTRWQMLGVALAMFAGYLAVGVVVLKTGQGGLLVKGVFWFVVSTLTAVVGAHLSFGLREREFYTRYELEKDQRKTEQLLRNILPSEIVERLKREPRAIADAHAEATILFADIVGFTTMSESLPPEKVVALLDELFSEFDQITERYDLEKIKTIGDAYMVAGGIPEGREDHAEAVAAMALEMREAVARFQTPTGGDLGIRIGINSGPVVAGVIGTKKFLYDLWGDAVNTASRMESHAEPGTIQVTQETADLISGKFVLESRGVVSIKGKGDMDTYLLVNAKAQA